MTDHAHSGFDVLYDACHASGGSTALLHAAVEDVCRVSSGGRWAVSSADVAEIVSEVWHSSGGSRAQFEERLRRRFGLTDGGRKFLAALSLAGTLQAGLIPYALAAIYAPPYTPEVGSGVTVTSEVLGPGNVQTILSGGTANSASIWGSEKGFKGGTGGGQVVFGEANDTTLGSYSIQIASAGGIVNSTTLSGLSVLQYIFSGGIANHTIINGRAGTSSEEIAGQGVVEGGIAYSTIVNLNGVQAVVGGQAHDTIVNSGGILRVNEGGSSFGVTQRPGGSIDVDVSGGDSTYVSGTNADGNPFSLSNGVASNFILYDSGGEQRVRNGGSVVGTIINAGRQTIENGGTASSTTVNAQGEQTIRSGGLAVGTIINAGGSQTLQGGGVTSSTTVNSGGILGMITVYGNEGGSSFDVIQKEGGNIDVLVREGAITYVSGTNASGGFTLSNGVASNFIVYSGGKHTVIGRGSSLNVIQREGGNIDVNVEEGATTYVSGTNASGGFTLSNGVASNFIVYSGGKHTVSGGGSSFNILQREGGNINVDVMGNDTSTYVSGTNASSVKFTLEDGVASNFIIYSGGSQIVRDGGSAVNTVVHSGGAQTIHSGGSSIDVTQMSGGNIFFGSGNDIHISGTNASGENFTYENGSANNFIIYYLHNETKGALIQNIASGVKAYDTILDGGWMNVEDGGFASGTVIHEEGFLSVESGGVASATTIHSGGRIEIKKDGSALGIVQSSGGVIKLNVMGGDTTVVTGTHSPDGKQFSYSGGIASNFTVYDEGSLNVSSGGEAHSTVIHSGGGVYIYSGGSAVGTIVNSDGVQDIRQSGGLAADTTVRSGGTLQIANSGILAGSNYLDEGSILIASGAVVLNDAGTVLHLMRNKGDRLQASFTGSGRLIKDGSGTLVLDGKNSYSGGTVVSEGALGGYAGSSGGLGSLQGEIEISNGAIVYFDQQEEGTFEGKVKGSGSLIKAGSGALTLTSANIYSGLTEVREGKLILSGSGSLTAPKELTLYGGTTFDDGTGAAPQSMRLRSATSPVRFEQFNVYGHSYSIDSNKYCGATYKGSVDATSAVMNFYLPSDYEPIEVLAGTSFDSTIFSVDSLLTVDGATILDESTTKVNVKLNEGINFQADKDSLILLIDAKINGVGALSGKAKEITVKQINDQGLELSVDYEFEPFYVKDSSGVNLEFFGIKITGINIINEDDKPIAGDQLGDLGGIVGNVDLAAGLGIDALLDTTREGYGRNVFAVVDGGNVHYKNGPRDNHAVLMTGIVGDMQLDAGELAVGAFVTHGDGKYDVSHDRGKGDTGHTGAGVLARLDFSSPVGDARPYVEGSFQAGRSKVDSNVEGKEGRIRYDTSASYIGAHAGAGAVWNLRNGATFDFYGKYLYARRGDDSVRTKGESSERMKFDAIESQRLRVGSRYRWTVGNLSPYAGVAWEHEFDGRVRVRKGGSQPAVASDVKGGTAIAEIGLSLRPSPTSPLSIEFGVQGFSGKREGATGNLRVEYWF